MEPDKGETRSERENHEGQEHSAKTRPRANSLVLKVFHERMRRRGEMNKLASRLVIDDTCSTNAGILNIISEVEPSCFTSLFTYHAKKDKTKR